MKVESTRGSGKRIPPRVAATLKTLTCTPIVRLGPAGGYSQSDPGPGRQTWNELPARCPTYLTRRMPIRSRLSNGR
jgi:hypothetical protein